MEALAELSNRVKITAKGGQEWRFDCPFCITRIGRADTKGHLYFNRDSQLWMCHRCKAKGGGAERLLDEGFGIRISGSVSPISSWRPEPSPQPEAPKPKDKLEIPPEAVAIELGTPPYNYLTWPRAKKIEGLGSCREMPPDWIRQFGLLDWVPKRRIFIPVFAGGELTYWIARGYLGQEPKYLNPSVPRRKVIFNYDQSRLSDRIYICEGPFSAMAFGPQKGVALLGKQPTKDQIELLCEHPAREMVVAFDGDAFEDTLELSANLFKWVGATKQVFYMQFTPWQDPGDFSLEELEAKTLKPYDPLLSRVDLLRT
jgi:hypothetical protein